jgi:CRISPR-associated endoribonuclease Cas6
MKRIFIELKIFNEGLISYNLNHKISSFIYSLLSEDLPEIHNTKKSNFTFSNIMFENFTPQKNGMKLKSNKGVVIISTTNEKIVDVLINNIKYNKNYQLDNFYFNIINIKLDSDKILNDVVCFKTITPICLTKAYIREDGKLRQKFLSPHDDEYKEYFLKNILNKTDRNIVILILK